METDSNPGNNQDSTNSRARRVKYDFTFKMITIGDKATGKTCCINRYSNNSFSDANVATLGVGSIVKPISYKDKNIKL